MRAASNQQRYYFSFRSCCEVEEAAELTLAASGCGFQPGDLEKVVAAIDGAVKGCTRRNGCLYHPMILHMFTKREWSDMLHEDATAHNILEVILKRVVLLKGFVLNEYSTKYLTSLWIYCQKINDKLTSTHKPAMHTHVKKEHKKLD